MAYNPNDLSALSYANGFTLWHYKTADAPTTVDTTGYFNEAAGMLRVGDFIMANTNVGGAVQSGVLVVTDAGAGTVDVANMLVVGTANSD